VVQMKKVPGIEQAWIEHGSPYCEHERTDQEFELGSRTGDEVCLDCGEVWSRRGDKPAPRGNKA